MSSKSKIRTSEISIEECIFSNMNRGFSDKFGRSSVHVQVSRCSVGAESMRNTIRKVTHGIVIFFRESLRHHS